MALIIPDDYRQKLMPESTEQAIQLLKTFFQEKLTKTLNLRRVTAPLFVLSGTGINDDLNGVERAVKFNIKCMGDRQAEVVHSLAKWKRMKLGDYRIPAGYGLYTDMNAIRSDEDLDNLHSLYVDQWDWEKTITAEQRSLDYLKKNSAPTIWNFEGDRTACVRPVSSYHSYATGRNYLYPFRRAPANVPGAFPTRTGSESR